MDTFLLTCIIPAHRGTASLQRAVDSVLAQDLATGLILVDDASGDDTWGLIQRIAARHPRQVQGLQLAANRGPACARNAGAGLADSRYLAFLDQDDEWRPGFARRCTTLLEQQQRLAAVKTGIHYAQLPERMAIAPGEARDAAMVGMHGCNMVIRREAFWALGGFPGDAVFRGPLGGEDSALQRGLKGIFYTGLVKEPLYRYHWRPGNVLDRFASRTRSEGPVVRYARLEPPEQEGSLEQALRQHDAQVKDHVAQLRRLLIEAGGS
jgi:glycosyltransferase involved in cell wall biosynthesis